MPTCYAHDGGCVYVHTVDGMKRHAMQTNPQVCFGVERVDDSTPWRSVIAWGSHQELTGDDAARGMRKLVDRLMPILRPMRSRAYPRTSARLATMYRIRLVEKTRGSNPVRGPRRTRRSRRGERRDRRSPVARPSPKTSPVLDCQPRRRGTFGHPSW